MSMPIWLQKHSLATGLGLLALGWGLPAQAAELDVPQRVTQKNETTALPSTWQPASADDQTLIWRFVLQSPMGIAALNQLAIEGFISPVCTKTLYTHEVYESFQSLLQVQCPTPRGVSAARTYDEMRITFNRFEDTINDFSVERIYTD